MNEQPRIIHILFSVIALLGMAFQYGFTQEIPILPICIGVIMWIFNELEGESRG